MTGPAVPFVAHPRSSCALKRRYGTEREAQRVIGRMRWNGTGDRLLAPYVCTFCGGWHVGHPPGSRSISRPPALRGF